MSEWWSPKPRREINKGGLFAYGDDDEVKIEKSEHNRWKNQRDADGTPHTRIGHSALVPPAIGPDLYIADAKVAKAIAADSGPQALDKDPDDVVKSYLSVSADMLAKGFGEKVKAAGASATEHGKAGMAAGSKAANKVVGAVMGLSPGAKSISSDDALSDDADRKKPDTIEKK